MIATRSRGRPKLTTMPMIATTASVVSMEFSEGQGGQHYRASGRGGQCRRGWNTPLTRRAYPTDSPGESALGELLRDALGDRRLVRLGELPHARQPRAPPPDAPHRPPPHTP